jgi:hypothetical protein
VQSEANRAEAAVVQLRSEVLGCEEREAWCIKERESATKRLEDEKRGLMAVFGRVIDSVQSDAPSASILGSDYHRVHADELSATTARCGSLKSAVAECKKAELSASQQRQAVAQKLSRAQVNILVHSHAASISASCLSIAFHASLSCFSPVTLLCLVFLNPKR